MIQDFRGKYRPRTFSEFVGNANAIRILKNIVRSGSLRKGILIHGPAGTGKTTLAQVFLRSVFCKNFQMMFAASVRAVCPLQILFPEWVLIITSTIAPRSLINT